MRVREDYRTLNGAEKAAILLLSLGEEYTAKVFEQLDEDEILQLSQTMSNLGKISSNVGAGLSTSIDGMARGSRPNENAISATNGS